MPVRIDPPPPANSTQPGINTSLLYSGSKFQGHQKSKGNCYDVEVVLQVTTDSFQFCALRIKFSRFFVSDEYLVAVNSFSYIVFKFHFAACGHGELVSLWLFED